MVEQHQKQVVELEPAKDNYKDKKYVVTVENMKIPFGQHSASDYTIHKDEERKNRYISRHSNEEKFWDATKKQNLYQASFWSRYLLWEKPSIFEALQNIERMSNVKIKYNKSLIQKHQTQLAKAVSE